MATDALLALLVLATPTHAQPGTAGGTCVVSIMDRGTSVQAKGSLSVGTCFGPGQDIVSPPGTVVKVVTPLKDTIAVSGTLRIKEQSPKGQSFWVRSGTAAFNVVAKQLSFFNVEGQNGNRTFQAAVRGTTFEVAVEEGKRVTLTPLEGEIRVTHAVKLGITGAERTDGKRDLEAARAAGAGGRAAEALKPSRSDLLSGSYAGRSELVSGGGAAVEYALDKDDVVSFATVEECVESFTAQLADDPGSEGYRNLGDCYLEGNDPQRAISSYNKALAADLRLHPDGQHPDVAEDYRSLADGQSFTDPRAAIASLQRALAIDAAFYGGGAEPAVAEDHRTLADLHLLLDDPDGAIAELQQALAIDQQLDPDGVDFDLAEDHRSLGESYTLAAIASGSGAAQLNSAIGHFRKALAIDENLYGNDADPDLAADHRGLGFAYQLAGRPGDAFASFDRALATGFGVLGVSYDGHPATADVSTIDIESDDVDEDVVADLFDDATTLSEVARAMGNADQADAFEELADRIAAILEGD